MRRRILIALLLSAGLAAGTTAWVRDYLDRPLTISAPGYQLEIARGSSWAAVAHQVASDGVTPWAPVLLAYGRLSGQSGRIQAGEYLLPPGTTPRTLLAELSAGRVVQHKLTLVEGWSLKEILRAIAAEPALRQTLAVTDPAALSRELGLQLPSAEGAFLPETYLFARGTTDRDLLLRANAALNDRLARAWTARSPNLPLARSYELLILASIVERETALARERPLIAGVFVRRLQKGMRLQTDPTVIYGLGSRFDGNLTRLDLETDTPWNTYTRDGLPPTPIAAASGAAIDAAARPAEGTALFFVATGAGDGSHRFTNTLEEHQAAIRDYLAALNRRDQD